MLERLHTGFDGMMKTEPELCVEHHFCMTYVRDCWFMICSMLILKLSNLVASTPISDDPSFPIRKNMTNVQKLTSSLKPQLDFQ